MTFQAKGKLLLSAEYMVLHGSRALALPLKKGQAMKISLLESGGSLQWEAEDSSGTWFKATLDPERWRVVESSQEEMAERLLGLLRSAAELKPAFQARLGGKKVCTLLDYPRAYGLGSSSSLLSLVAGWSGCEPLELHRRTSVGSGYDVAAAGANGPLLYWLDGDGSGSQQVSFRPPFHSQLYFAWLGHKQDTAASLDGLGKGFRPGKADIEGFTELSLSMLACEELNDFRELIEQHEQRLSGLLGIRPVSERFRDLDASVKSLGAWGGDFILLASPLGKRDLAMQLRSYGLQTVYSYKDLVHGAEI